MATALIRTVTAIVCLLALTAAHADLRKLNYLTESYPPYNMIEGEELRGLAVDLLVAATARSGQAIKRSDIKVQPWPRAYRSALDGPGVVLFSTTRTEERDPLFQWVGPIADTRIVLLAHKDRPLTLPANGNLSGLVIGVIRDDIGEQLARAQGAVDANIRHVPNAESLARMLNKGRIDAWAYEENVGRWFIRQAGLNNEDFVAHHTLKEAQLYFSLSTDIDSATVQQLQQAVDAVKADKAVMKDITDRYM
ncbi:amino acid ABC transporter substrate-binding protein [Bacterioplanes sanyensis]|uniref:Amino acid ABC transporter substrate-binding protein n=1 Tax=Bacterioplanes sanyensis TaxID=1249553 RepID=A0A222FJ65_9GAMM|nr:transporter substrate-binding domain-containing protein [Bacterioplanes sanyensis]ASP38820.1 amino acid ABC transporter substrate-binding protein [Bacterioplanes sanyensis]